MSDDPTLWQQEGLGDTLHDERERLKVARWRPEGATCGACGQHVKVYRRKIYAAMAVPLVHVYARQFGDGAEWVHVSELPIVGGRSGGGDFAKLELWGLIEAKPHDDDPAKRCSGLWRCTDLGARFVRGEVRVPKYLYLYSGRVLRESLPEYTVDIFAALPQSFNYTEVVNFRRPGAA